MNKLKNILLIVFCFMFLSGCTVRSNVEVGVDGKTTETVEVLADSSIFESEKYSKKELVEFSMERYLPVLDYRGYSYDTTIGKDLSGARVSNTYDNICSYFQDTAFNQYVYHHVKCTENDYYYTIENDTDYIPYCSDCSDWPALDDVELSISLPIAAEENNADSVNGNTYVWKYGKSAPADKNFYLKINKSALKENEENFKETQKRKSTLKYISIIGVILVIIIVLFIIGKVLYKKYQSNKLDY